MVREKRWFKFYIFKNYHNSISKNNKRKSDGLVIFIRKDIHHITPELEILYANCLWIILIYSSNIIQFIEDLGLIILNVVSSYKQTTLIIIGDIHIDLLSYFNFIHWIYYINGPTWSASHSCMDHIFIKDNFEHLSTKITIINFNYWSLSIIFTIKTYTNWTNQT